MPKSTTFLGNFCRGFKFYHFSSEIILGNFYKHLAIFSGHIGSMYLLLELCGSIPMIRQKNVDCTIFKSKLFVKGRNRKPETFITRPLVFTYCKYSYTFDVEIKTDNSGDTMGRAVI